MKKTIPLRSGRSLTIQDKGTGPVIVCLHGLGGGAFFFDELTDSLKGRFRTISFDMPGTGENIGVVEDFSTEACIKATVDILDHLAPEHVNILGHSMGTIIALITESKRAAQVDSMIFLGGLPKPIPSIQERLSQRIERIATGGMTSASEAAMKGIFAKRTLETRKELVSSYRERFESLPPKLYKTWANELIAADASSCVENVLCDCLAITGDEDHYAPPEKVKFFTSLLPQKTETIVFENCGHMIFFEDCKRLFSEISRFCLQR